MPCCVLPYPNQEQFVLNEVEYAATRPYTSSTKCKMIKMVFRNICNVTLGITVQGRGFKGMVARIACRKAET